MATLHVRPIDTSAPGSYRKRKRVMATMQKLERARSLADGGALSDADREAANEAFMAFADLDDLILENVYAEDGGDVQEILDQISADDFDRLLAGLLGSSVPTKSAGA